MDPGGLNVFSLASNGMDSADKSWTWKIVEGERLLMAEILHHLGCVKPYK